MKVCLVVLAAAACSLAAAGCRDDHSDHVEDEHEHAGHIIPAHKPKTFPDAVRRLRELNRRIVAAAFERKVSSLVEDGVMPEAIDIATWLPEIAADSDMPEQPWNRVNARAGAILASYQALAGDRPGDAPAALNDAERAISDLEALLSDADPRWFDGAAAVAKTP